MNRSDIVAAYPHLKEFFPYLDYLSKESDRGKVLITAGFLEEQLKQVLLAYFLDCQEAVRLVEGGNAPIGTFSARISTCYVLGLVAKAEYDDLQLIRRIRNDFAHDLHTSFTTQSVIDRCARLEHRIKDYGEVKMPPAGQFTTTAVALIAGLTNRPHFVRQQRRTLAM